MSGAWAVAVPEESPVPFPFPPGSVPQRGGRPEEGVRTGGGRGPRLHRPRPGGSGGCVLPGPRRTQGFRAEDWRQLRDGSRRDQPSAGGTAAACPSPAANCGGTRARLRGRPSRQCPRVPSAFTGGGGDGCCWYGCCWPPSAAALAPALAPPSAAAAAASSPPLPSPLRRLLQRPLTRPDVTLPLHKPAQPNTLGLPLRPPTSPPRVLIGERCTSLPRRLADPTAYHEGGGESGRKRIRPLPENRRYLQVCLRGQVTEKGASQ